MRDEDSVRCIARTSAFSALQSALHCEKSSSSARSCSAGASSPIDTMSTSNGNESCSEAPLLSLQAKEATLASCVTAGCELHRRLRALQQVLHERRPQFAEMKRTIMIMLGWITRGHSMPVAALACGDLPWDLCSTRCLDEHDSRNRHLRRVGKITEVVVMDISIVLR